MTPAPADVLALACRVCGKYPAYKGRRMCTRCMHARAQKPREKSCVYCGGVFVMTNDVCSRCRAIQKATNNSGHAPRHERENVAVYQVTGPAWGAASTVMAYDLPACLRLGVFEAEDRLTLRGKVYRVAGGRLVEVRDASA